MYKKKFQFRFLVFFLIFSILSCTSEEERKAQYIKDGIQFFEQGLYKKSEIEIKNAIQANPKDANAHYYLALINEKKGNFRAMRQNLIESVKIAPENIEAKLKLSKVYLLFNQLDETSIEVESILTITPENPDALSVKAAILVRQKKQEDALKIIENILQKDNTHIEAASLKVALLIKDKLYDEALDILTPVIQKNQNNIPLLLLKIQLDSKRNDIDALISNYQLFSELKPDIIAIKNTLAKIYINTGNNQKAELIFRSIVKENPELVSSQIELLNFLSFVDEKQAIKEADIFIEQNQGNFNNLLIYAKWLVSKNKPEKAKKILNGLINNDDFVQEKKTKATLFLANVEIAYKNKDKALEILNDFIEKYNNVDAKYFKAEILSSNGNHLEAIEILEKVLFDNPKMDKALSLLGTINHIQGNMIKAYDYYKDALQINPKNLKALNFIINKEIREEQIPYAIELLERTLKFLPAEIEVLTKLIELNTQEHQWDNAQKYIETLSQYKKGLILSEYLNAKLAHEKNDFTDAIIIYKKLLESSPWVKDALIGMAESYSKLNQLTIMQDYLDFFIKKHPDLHFSYLLKSQLLSLENKNLKAIKFLKNAQNKQNIHHSQIYIELARLFSILKNKKEEFNNYTEGLAKNPDSIDLLIFLSGYYEKNGAFEKAAAEYEKILKINAKYNIAKNNLASILLDDLGSEDNINRALELTDNFKQSQQPYFLDTYGWAQLKKGNLNKALSIFKQVILLEPNVAIFHYHLAVAHFQLGDKMAAASELREAKYLGKGKSFKEKVLIDELLAKIQNQATSKK